MALVPVRSRGENALSSFPPVRHLEFASLQLLPAALRRRALLVARVNFSVRGEQSRATIGPSEQAQRVGETKRLDLERNSQTLVQKLGPPCKQGAPHLTGLNSKLRGKKLPTIRVSFEAVACPRPVGPSGAKLTGKVKQTPTLTCTRRSSRDNAGDVHFSTTCSELQVSSLTLTRAVLQVENNKLPKDQSIRLHPGKSHPQGGSSVGRCRPVLLVFPANKQGTDNAGRSSPAKDIP